MSQLDAIALSAKIRTRLVDFSLGDHFVKEKRLQDICKSLWDGPPEAGGLVGDLWVETAPPATASSQTLESLGSSFNSVLREQLDKPDVWPHDRLLYKHQLEAIEEARSADGESRPALVITAGTGAGKTESFLFPILNDLFSEAKPAGQGIRCLILYPMNALVNDQVERLEKWLEGQDRVTLFHMTSETPEDYGTLKRTIGDLKIEKSRYRTRQRVRGLETADGRKRTEAERGPQPDILVTNYSMLEYMLCRPQDAVFFGPGLRTCTRRGALVYGNPCGGNHTSATPNNGAITPPTMLQTTRWGPRFKRGRTDPIHDANLLLVDLDLLHQRPNDLPSRVPVRLLQFLGNTFGELLQLADHQPEFRLLGGLVCPLPTLVLPLGQALSRRQDPRLEFRLVEQPVAVGIDQSRNHLFYIIDQLC